MEITSIEGKIDILAFPGEGPMNGTISSEAQGEIVIRIPYDGLNKSPNRKVLHDIISSGSIKTVILSGGPAKVDFPNDAVLIGALMDVAGVEEFRINRWDAIRAQGMIESFLDHETEEYIIRRVKTD